MNEFFESLFSPGFMPHGHCFFWTPSVLWLNVISDIVIATAYYSIPIALFYFVRKRKDLAFNWIFTLFALFIFACGTTHLMEVWNVWNGSYGVAGIIKAVTALVSIGTAILLWSIMPEVLQIPTREALDAYNLALKNEVDIRKKAQEEAISFNKDMELRAKKAIDQEHEVSQRFRSLTENIPHLVWTTFPDGTDDYINAHWYAYTGLSTEEMTDNGWLKSIHPDDMERTRQIWNTALNSGTPYRAEYRLRAADGSYTWFLALGIPLKNDAGEIIRWYGTCTDISEYKT